jgi:hypothetical protein
VTVALDAGPTRRRRRYKGEKRTEKREKINAQEHRGRGVRREE